MKTYCGLLLQQTQRRWQELDSAVRQSAGEDPLRFALRVAAIGFVAGVLLRSWKVSR
jgi:hypothetical protein